MAIIGGELGYHILQKYTGNGDKVGLADAVAYQDKSKLEILMGSQFFTEIKNKVVIDFGCGTGMEAIEMAQKGARKVIGVDLQDKYLELARREAEVQGVSARCEFAQTPSEPADVIVALDSFEHFADPADILRLMRRMLKPKGFILASFGPIWFHPYGGHLFSVFPWSHLVFSEKALMRWRSGFKSDGATRFEEVEGGLNQMTIRRFKKIVQASPFSFAEFSAVPIRKLRWLANPLTREFTTAVVRCKLVAE